MRLVVSSVILTIGIVGAIGLEGTLAIIGVTSVDRRNRRRNGGCWPVPADFPVDVVLMLIKVAFLGFLLGGTSGLILRAFASD